MMSKPNFTGTWRFDPRKSALQIPTPDSTLFIIEHREPVFHFSRTHVFQGKADTIDLQLTTDGKEITGQHGDIEFRSRAFWDEETLVFETNLQQGEDDGVNIVRYKLGNAGNLLMAEESLRSRRLNYENKWVLTRSKTPQ